MRFSEVLLNDKRVQDFHKSYLVHPFVLGLKNGNLPREKFRNYLIQDSLYLKDYAKVYAGVFMLAERVQDLQFLHECIGVVTCEETNMHAIYLKNEGLDIYMVDNMETQKENREYLDYMLSFIPGGDIKKIFMSALPCTLTYGYIGTELKKSCGASISNNYYGPWIEAYAGASFDKFCIDSLKFVDWICRDINEDESDELIEIYLKACEHEMEFWNMSFK